MALTISMITGELLFLGIQKPDDPFFLFISNNKAVVTLRLLLVAAALVVSFKNRFIYKLSHQAAGRVGSALVAFGAIGAMSQTMINVFGSFFKIFDFLLLTEIGLIFCLAAISYQPGRRKVAFNQLLLSRMPKQLSLKLNPYLMKSKTIR